MGRAIMRRPNARIVLVRTNAPNGRPSIPPFALVWGVCVGSAKKFTARHVAYSQEKSISRCNVKCITEMLYSYSAAGVNLGA